MDRRELRRALRRAVTEFSPHLGKDRRLVVSAMALALEWGRRAGIEFEWLPDDGSYDQHENFEEIGGEDFLQCNAYLRGELLKQSHIWWMGTYQCDYARWFAEAQIALEIMSDFNSIDGNYVF
jgi:hypothetical protein